MEMGGSALSDSNNVTMLKIFAYITLVVAIPYYVSCDVINVIVPYEPADAFQSTWNIIKTRVPINFQLRRSKRTGITDSFTTTTTTERATYLIRIPVLPAPKSKFQDLYRMKSPPSPMFNVEKAEQWLHRIKKTVDTTTRKRIEEDDNLGYLMNFKKYRLRLFYNINLI